MKYLSAMVLVAAASLAQVLPIHAQETLELVVETQSGKMGYPCVKYQKKLYLALEDLGRMTGSRGMLELEGRKLLASDASHDAESALLLPNRRLANDRQGVLISENVIELEGRYLVPLDDVMRATGARRTQTSPDQLSIMLPDHCSDCALVRNIRR